MIVIANSMCDVEDAETSVSLVYFGRRCTGVGTIKSGRIDSHLVGCYVVKICESRLDCVPTVLLFQASFTEMSLCAFTASLL